MISGKILRDAIISGANNINNQRSRVDELNVFPVPDGDTGTNMYLTIQTACAELNKAEPATIDDAAKITARGLLTPLLMASGRSRWTRPSVMER